MQKFIFISICWISIIFSPNNSLSQDVAFTIQTPISEETVLKVVEYNYILNQQDILFHSALKKGEINFVLDIDNGKKLRLGNNEIFVEPGTTVSLTLDSMLIITEVNAEYPGNYTILQQLNLLNSVPDIRDPASPEEIKIGFKKVLNARMDVVEEARKSKSISPEFYEYLKAEYTSRYLSGMFYTLNKIYKDSLDFPDFFVNEFNKDKFLEPKNLSSMFYAFALDDYVSYLSKTFLLYTEEAFIRKQKAIHDNFEGLQREFLLSYMFRNYCKKQFPGYAEVLTKSYNNLMNEQGGITEPTYLQCINDYYQYYKKANKDIPSSIMEFPLEKANASYSLKTVLKEGNSTKIILFWASWCTPCIKEIMELKEKFPGFNSPRYDFIFISTDEDILKFNAMADKLQIDSYLIRENIREFSNFFDLSALPRHVLYQDNLIKDLNFNLKLIF